MAKALKIAAVVVGVVALTIATAGLFAPAATAAFLGSIATGLTISTALTALSVVSGVLSIAAALTAPKPGFGKIGGAGSQLEFTADPAGGEPYVMGDARVGMAIVHEASWGDKNRFLGLVGALSCAGPINAYDGFYADDTLIAFSGGNATGYYHGFMFLRTQLGARPESAALSMTAPDASTMPDWGSSYKLSSLAAAGLILVADVDNGKIYSSGAPKMTHQVRGVKAYDPRADSTNGGSGTQRPGGLTQAETNYAYSANPWVHHGTFALGRWVQGVKVIGAGLPATSMDWTSHIEAANIADANGWTVSGRVMSTDRKWDVLKSIAQAGGGYPIPTAARLACLVNTPRVSLETIEESHLKGAVTAPQMTMRRDRLNGAIPRFRSPDHAWEVVSGGAVRNSAYLAADGGTTRTREIDLPLVADADQAAQLVAYEVANSRERSPIEVEVDLYWSQYKMGDCLSLNLPSALLFNQKAVIISREIDSDRNTVRFGFRTEDDAKHTWALGVTGTAPPPTTVGSDPGAGDTGGLTLDQIQNILRTTYLIGTIDAIDAGSNATIRIHGATVGSNFTLDYPGTLANQSITQKSITGKAYTTLYYPYADVDPDTLLPTSYGAATIYGDSINSADHPYRIGFGRAVTTPAAAGGTTTGGGTGGGGYGGGGGTGSGGEVP